MDDQFTNALESLLRKLLVLDRNEKVCFGVTIPQCYTIETLHKHGRLSMNELSRELGIAVSTLTRIIDILVRDEIISRSPSPDDRRKVCVVLTEKGIELALKLAGCTLGYIQQILLHIPEEKRRQVTESLDLLNEAIAQTGRSCCG